MNVPSMEYTTVTAGSTPPVPLRLTAANAKQRARPVVARTSAAPPTRESNSKNASDMISTRQGRWICRSRSHSDQEVARPVRPPASVKPRITVLWKSSPVLTEELVRGQHPTQESRSTPLRRPRSLLSSPPHRASVHHHRWPSIMVVLARPNYVNHVARLIHPSENFMTGNHRPTLAPGPQVAPAERAGKHLETDASRRFGCFDDADPPFAQEPRRPHPFTAPAAKPPTSRRWMSSVRRIGGNAITLAAAMRAPQFVVPSPMKLKLATIAVLVSYPDSTKANKK